MGVDKSRSQYEAFLVSDPRWKASEIWEAESTFDEADREVRRFAPDAGIDTELILEGSGIPTAEDDINVRTVNGGTPAPDGAGFAWRTGGTGDWYGWHGQATNAYHRQLKNNSSPTDGEVTMDCVAVADDTLVIAASHWTGGQRQVQVRRVDTAGTSLGPVLVDPGSGTVLERFPTMVVLPDDSIILFAMTIDNTQVKAFRSQDKGATWTAMAEDVLPEDFDPTTYPVDKMRAAYGDGQIVLFITGTAVGPLETTFQYASDDFGHTFEAIDDNTGGGLPRVLNVDVVFVEGFFVIVYDVVASDAQGIRLGSAFDKYTDADTIDTPGAMGDSTTMILADDSTIWRADEENGTGPGDNIGELWKSIDFGQSWEDVGNWYNNSLQGGSLTGSPKDICGAWIRGQLFIVGNQEHPAGDATRSTNIWRVNSFTNVTHRGAWGNTTFGLDTFVGYGLTDNSLGAPTESVNTDGTNNVTTGAGDTGRYDFTNAAAGSATFTASQMRARIDQTSGTGGIEISSSTTTDNTIIRFEVAGGVIRVRDIVGSVTLATIAITPTDIVEVWLASAGRNANAWYRIKNDDAIEEEDWINAVDTATLTLAGATANAYTRVVIDPSSDVDFHTVSTGGANAGDLAAGFTNPDDLLGRPYPVTTPGYATNGVSIAAIDGPTFRGDEFTMEVGHARPIENLFPLDNTSPGDKWRSETTTTSMAVAVRFLASDLSYLLNESIAVWYEGNVTGSIDIQGYDAGWSTIATLRPAIGALRWRRDGSIVRPGTGGAVAPAPYFARNELAGSWFEYDGSPGTVRKIVANGEGTWTPLAAQAQKRPWLQLEDVAGGDPASGTGGTIWFKRAALVFHAAPMALYEGVRIVIDTVAADPSPIDGYFEAKVMLGHLVFLGTRGDRTRTHTRIPNVEVVEFEDGTRRMRQLGPQRIREEFAIARSGVKMGQLRGDGNPDFVKGTQTGGSLPAGAANDTALLLDGLFEELDGPLRAAVYLPKVAAGAPDTITLTNERTGGAVYGHLRGEYQTQDYLGDPFTDEQRRVQVIVFEQLL